MVPQEPGWCLLTSLPLHLFQCIVQRLPREALLALRSTARLDGVLEQRMAGLKVPLAALDLDHQPGRGLRLDRMTALTRLTLEPCAAEELDPISPCGLHSEQEQAQLLLTRHLPLMASITTLKLDGLYIDSVVRAAIFLSAAACPAALTRLTLSRIQPRCSSWPSGWERVWAALSRASPRLERLTVAGCDLGDTDLSALPSVTHLRRLCLKDGYESRCLVDLQCLQQLTQLKIKGMSVEPRGLTSLTNLRTLKLLEQHEINLRQDTFQAIANWPHLSHLEVPDWKVLDDNGDDNDVFHVANALWRCVGSVQFPVPLRSLVFLDIGDEGALLSDVTFLCNLTSLTCGVLCPPVQLAFGAPAGGDCLPELRRLKCGALIPDFSEEEPGTSLALAAAFPRLESMNLSWFSAELPAGWVAGLWPGGTGGTHQHLRQLTFTQSVRGQQLPEELAACCPALESFSLYSWEHESLRLSYPAVRSLGRHVRELTVAPADDAELIEMMTACPNVATLVISRVQAEKRAVPTGHLEVFREVYITDSGVAAVSRSPRLQNVTLELCPQVTAAGVLALAANRSVRRIRVLACALFQAAGDVEHVMRSSRRPWLDLEVEKPSE